MPSARSISAACSSTLGAPRTTPCLRRSKDATRCWFQLIVTEPVAHALIACAISSASHSGIWGMLATGRLQVPPPLADGLIGVDNALVMVHPRDDLLTLAE